MGCRKKKQCHPRISPITTTALISLPRLGRLGRPSFDFILPNEEPVISYRVRVRGRAELSSRFSFRLLADDKVMSAITRRDCGVVRCINNFSPARATPACVLYGDRYLLTLPSVFCLIRRYRARILHFVDNVCIHFRL